VNNYFIFLIDAEKIKFHKTFMKKISNVKLISE